jgi:hypothetical protein
VIRGGAIDGDWANTGKLVPSTQAAVIAATARRKAVIGISCG